MAVLTRRRAEQAFQESQAQLGPRLDTISAFHGGYNGYTDPVLLSPSFWAASANIYSGQHGDLVRARFANVVIPTTAGYDAQGQPFTSLYDFRDIAAQANLLSEAGGRLWSFAIQNSPNPYTAIQRINPSVDTTTTPSLLLYGPWSRQTLQEIVLEMNGQVKQIGLGVGALTIYNFGIDSPNTSAAVTKAGGAITTTVGRSYQYAWENSAIAHVGPPSPATPYIVYTAQQGTIDLVQPGLVTTIANGVVGSGGANFSPAWVGMYIWIDTAGSNTWARINAVTDATHLTLDGTPPGGPYANKKFQVYDIQADFIRLYATGDGGSVYFRIQRNAFVPAAASLAGAGLEFVDNDNSEPPNGEFTTEQAQVYNLPPPIGSFLGLYQGRIIVYGVPAAKQTFFYSNLELTTIGQPFLSFAPLNTVTLPIGDSIINGDATLPTGYILWSDKQDMFKLSGTLVDNSISTPFQGASVLYRLPYQIGCASPFATAVTNLGVFWLSSDREVWLFTDNYAPKNIGRPVQDLLNSISQAGLSAARMVHFKSKDHNLICLAIASNGATANDTILILDLDLLGSNGQPSYFTFDLVGNAPSWWIFKPNVNPGYPLNISALGTVFDSGSVNALQHVLFAQSDYIMDGFYDGASFKNGPELPVYSNITLQWLGNEQPETIKRIRWVRFVTNQQATFLQSQGWEFGIDYEDDDTTSISAPGSIVLSPGVDSPATLLPNENGPDVFRLGGVKYAIGRRFRFKAQFPLTPGNWRMREIQVSQQVKYAR